ncbi:cell division ATP-binding protein FtsE [Pasteuria penetrans]|uniref:cell division ATP-binding protein FtsE n=1 Tax=Pasteuria penetrans TaxID=86005 RepID=UPI000FB2EB46|nr:cell division ATP-binding protein FtsE [Pasteuria penetrans]
MIEMHGVWKIYGNGVEALRDVDVCIQQGEFVYVVGPSGAGKSSFVKLMYREEKPTHGVVLINGVNIKRVRNWKIPHIRRQIGIVFQDFKLLPAMTVRENVAFAMEVIEAPRSQIKDRVEEVLSLVGLQDRMDERPPQLSGGEQQRVAVARAIVNQPSFIIADEPTGNLDAENTWDIMYLFEEINKRGTTIVMVTHNREIVNLLRQRVLAMEGGVIVRDEPGGEYGYDD